ncbi:MAG: type II toxin-antitoxin system RelE/ParE family toxin [Planctomycetes bacterium]|nr:type II toxin-antitoxin system RelE/ParE family toxin [Planctomycetota bacterium]
MAEVVWTGRAREDLREILEYISRDSRAYAQSFALRLHRKVTRLSDFPRSGHVIPEDPKGIVREVIVGNYRVLYFETSDRVAILTVVHGARRIDPPSAQDRTRED